MSARQCAILYPTLLSPTDDCAGDLVCNSQNVCTDGEAVGAHCSATGMELVNAADTGNFGYLNCLLTALLQA